VPPLRDLIEDAHRRSGAPAMGAALVDAEGAGAVAVTGTRVRGRDLPVAEDDPWHLGSCTKAMTAAVYARLVESGRAAWGAPLAELFPDLAGAAHAGWRAVTIDDVLLHRAGLRANLPVSEMRRAATDLRPLRDARTAVVAEALARPPERPGTFRYSNVGYTVAGAAIERIADATWEDALRAELLDPLGIASAGVGPPAGDAPWGHRTLLGGLGRGAPVDPADPVLADNPAVMGPAGRVHMPLREWARFVAQFLEGGAGLLGDESVARLVARPAGAGQAQAMGWVHPDVRATRRLGAPVAFGMQGSNRRWVATALVAEDRRRAALVVANDGRSRLLTTGALLAARLLREA
jgi:CubicO group peptidase (beta-lactamase class C family)